MTANANVESAPKLDMNRRDFLASTAAVGGAMVLGFYLPPTGAQAAAVAGQPWYRDPMVPEINAWLTIAPDDTVTIRVAQTEMGTGVFTSCSMMVAEELQCDWSKVRAEYASPHRNATERAPEWTLRVPGGGNPLDPTGGGEPAMGGGNAGVYRRMSTNSSGSVRESRYYLQMAGAEARERLRQSKFSILVSDYSLPDANGIQLSRDAKKLQPSLGLILMTGHDPRHMREKLQPGEMEFMRKPIEVAVLLDLFLVQPFTLLDSGFAGLTHVFIDLILLGSLRYAAHEER